MEEIAIKLPLNAWNVVLQALAKRPFEEVNELMAVIKMQGEEAVKALHPQPEAAKEDLAN